MKTDKKSLRLAKAILQNYTVKGSLDEKKVEKIIKLLSEEGSSKSKALLWFLEKLIKREEKNHRLVVESVFPLTIEEKNALKVFFEKEYERNLKIEEIENKSLISGIKIKLADDIWENSIQSKLTQLRGIINL